LRKLPRESASTFNTRVTSGAVMKELRDDFNVNLSRYDLPRA